MNKRMQLRKVMLALAVFFAAPALEPGQATTSRSLIDGYWEFSIEMPEQRINMLAELTTAPDGQVTLTALGPTDGREGRFPGGRFVENKLTLKVDLPTGVMVITMSLNGDKLIGNWVANSQSGNISAQRTKGLKEGVSYSSLTKVVWKCINDAFFDPHFNGANWEEVKARYLPQAKTARTNSEIITVIRQMLAELKVSHLDFFIAPEKPPVTYTTEIITWRKLSPEQGYLKIRDFDTENIIESSGFLSLLERAMIELSGLPSLIIDLRGNRGGSIDITLQAINYFLSDQRTVLYAATRAGLAKNKAGSLDQINLATLPSAKISDGSITTAIFRQGAVAITAGDAGRQAYKGRIALLIDERCYSGCELFAAILKESRSATLIGRRTGGEVLGANTVLFSKNMVIRKAPTRWRLRMPVIDFRTAGRMKLEGNGINPDIAVKPDGSGDADLSRALEVLSKTLR